MNYLKEFGIEYTDPELQYMNADFEAHDIVPAEYSKVSGCPDNPNIAGSHFLLREEMHITEGFSFLHRLKIRILIRD